MDPDPDENTKKFVQWDATKLQQRKLEKLMSNIDKPVEIPGKSFTKAFPKPPEFVRNIMGSSAGAGSGEFHVYRHLRRKEMARSKYMEEQARQEELDKKHREKNESMQRTAEERTAKKRQKRLKKKKQKTKKLKGTQKSGDSHKTNHSESSSGSDGDEEDLEDMKAKETVKESERAPSSQTAATNEDKT